MPFTPPSRTPSAGPRRRSLLVSAAGTVVLVGCSPGSESAAGKGDPAADRARARVARDSEALAERYAAVLAAHPALSGLLEPLRAEVVRHAEAFGGGAAATSSASKSSKSSSASVPPSPVPADERTALAELATAEKQLVDRRTKALLEVPGELARLMASVAAAGAGHVFLLTEGAR